MPDSAALGGGLPESLRDIFEALAQEVTSLHANWQLYLDLFGDSEKIAVLNATVPSVFQLIEEDIRAAMIMILARLLDPPKSFGKENLSLALLVERLKDHCDDVLHAEVSRQFVQIETEFAPISQHRNRRVAHNDFKTAINYRENPLPGIGRQKVTGTLGLIAQLMNRIELHFERSETAYSHTIQRGTGAHLIFLLEQAIEYDQKKRSEEISKRRSGC